jgi:hypothetical protein
MAPDDGLRGVAESKLAEARTEVSTAEHFEVVPVRQVVERCPTNGTGTDRRIIDSWRRGRRELGHDRDQRERCDERGENCAERNHQRARRRTR